MWDQSLTSLPGYNKYSVLIYIYIYIFSPPVLSSRAFVSVFRYKHGLASCGVKTFTAWRAIMG